MLEKAKTKGWDAKLVRHAMADAFRVLDATAGRVGHKRLKAAMPDYEYSEADLQGQRMMEVEAQAKGETTMRRRLLARVKPNSLEISRSDMVLFGIGDQKAWLQLVAAYPEHRQVLIAAVRGQAKRFSGRDVAKWLGMPHSTFQRHRDFAAGVIAKQLNEKGVLPW